ncbi:MAG: hypothetical protein G5Z42_00040 [Caldisphaeraceae archaeon]|nr:hypothetical protein [Desulfurococcales archaeon]MEB3797194.1 hypothetical protein [Caldisphaeraceae archaeon]
MSSKIALLEIIELISRLKDKIEKYSSLLQRNEMLVRYAVIDPFLRVLGWDTEDPEQVEPEFSMEAGVPDYALKINGEIAAFVEAKALGKHWDILKLITYATAKGVPYIIATDGDIWKIYDVFKRVEVEKKLAASWQITRDSPPEIALKALTIANLASKEVFGKPSRRPLLIQERIMESRAKQVNRRRTIEGPLTSKLARLLVLQVLAESKRAMTRKDIVKEIGKKVKLTDYDTERTKSGRIRWEARVNWAISHLYEEGLIERVQEGTYKIAKSGLKELTMNVE